MFAKNLIICLSLFFIFTQSNINQALALGTTSPFETNKLSKQGKTFQSLLNSFGMETQKDENGDYEITLIEEEPEINDILKKLTASNHKFKIEAFLASSEKNPADEKLKNAFETMRETLELMKESSEEEEEEGDSDVEFSDDDAEEEEGEKEDDDEFSLENVNDLFSELKEIEKIEKNTFEIPQKFYKELFDLYDKDILEKIIVSKQNNQKYFSFTEAQAFYTKLALESTEENIDNTNKINTFYLILSEILDKA